MNSGKEKYLNNNNMCKILLRNVYFLIFFTYDLSAKLYSLFFYLFFCNLGIFSANIIIEQQ